MSLAPGERLGPYEIVSALGAGGMGEVYRATDTNLKRQVAIKVLPDLLASDAGRLARFQREAEVLASLNHPNIAHIHGLEKSGAALALVMEFVDGEDLAQRLARGPVPLDEALAIARQIADALETAHEQGIIHRDLKPANIKVRDDGTVKVLDFGLAKLVDPVASGPQIGPGVTESPTITSPAMMTSAGMILGTAAYMSPEQAKGRPADRRSDIWSFGAVLFEMLTGARAFPGDDFSETFANVIKGQPDWAGLPAATPAAIRKLLGRCLEREPKRRLQAIGEARVMIDDTMNGSPEPALATAIAPAAPTWRRALPWAVAALVLSGAAFVTLRPTSTTSISSLELAIGPPDGRDFLIGPNSGNVTIAPNGATIAFVALATDGSGEPAVWIRPTVRDAPRMLSGTRGAMYPFWAPDSRSLAFFSDRKLRTVEISGGLPQVVADAPNGRGGCWADDGRILFTPSSGGTVMAVSATGGAVTPVTKLNAARAENANYWPTCLPGSKHFLYFARSAHTEDNRIYFANVDGTGEPTKVVSSLSSALYVARAGGLPGYLLWARDNDLLAQPFDAESGRTSGQAAKIASDVLVGEAQRTLMADASRTGMLVWASSRLEQTQFARFNRSGRRLSTLAIEPGSLHAPRISPDGRILAFQRAEKGESEIMLHDLASGVTRRVSTAPGYNQEEAWLPDGRGLVYVGDAGMTRLLLDGSSPPVTIFRKPRDIDYPDVTPDGRFVVIPAPADESGPERSLWAVGLQPPYTPTQLLKTSGEPVNCHLSPDGRWLLWGLSVDGRQETYLTRFIVDGDTPRLGAQRVLIASDSSAPVGWRRDGREIYYIGKNRDVIVLPVTLQGESATVGSPAKMFDMPSAIGDLYLAEATADGNRFIVSEMPFAKGQTIRVLTNWTARLQ